ncbi:MULTISPECIES: phage tail tape measure protein [unclassified Streptomyces]|uniref:phage tail tape measure protein n=1 Tax=unclassified Streptomyces TaxID=2593676 RepID=UPI000804F8C7|nr:MULTISPECIES: phage tail tape measure protein [unclassified Streptomyces]MYR76530.1 replication protein [Streptomyces sp. SID4925]SBU99993.1 Phage-related minor tail protein [Streptomyces sp. OspMP-M45]
MPRAGAVWVDVLPNMSNFGRQLQREIGEPVAQASARAGDEGGKSLMAGMKAKMLAGAAAVGVATGAVIVKGLEQALDKQKATGKLKAQLGLSVQDAKKAGEAAGKLFTGAVTESVDEGAAAVRATMSAGLAPPKATTKQLAQISTKVQDLQTLFEVDLGQAANAAGQAVKTGLAKNADEALDIMYRGFQVMGPRADDLADTFNEYSTIFRSMGLDMKTATGLMSQGMKAGARDTDVVADAVKEFTIEAVAGSDKIRGGYKLVGLDADKMFKMIGKGGDSAATAFDMTLDALRKVKDPVDRNAAAVELFGTKAEDMGNALYALDPSKAVADLGKVGGAAKRAGDDLRDNAGAKFEQFKRRALMVVGDAAAKYVLPRLMQFGRVLNSDVLPKVKDFAGFVDRRVVPVVKDVGSAFMTGARWVKEYGIWFAPLAIAIGGVTLALSANAIATSVTMGILGAYSIAIRGAAAVTRGWAAAQALFNSVMALNPITLIVIGVLALGAAAYIAFKKVGWFHDGVMAAWTGIRTGWDWLWTRALKPGFGYLMVGLRAVGTAASWLWTTVLSPVFGFIGTAARILVTAVVVVALLPIIAIFKLVAATASWLWSSVLSPVFGWIGAKAMWLWAKAIKPAWASIQAGVRAVGAAAKWLWSNVFSPTLTWIGDKASWLWSQKIKPAWNFIQVGIGLVGAKISELWTKYAKPIFQWVGDKASWLWGKALKPAFDSGKKGVALFADAFGKAKDAIKKAWDKVEGIAKKPVKFIIENVYNKGIVPTWNKVAKVFGAPTIEKQPLDGFARGGVLAGQSSYRQGDDQLVPLRQGEGIAVSEAMRDPYERKRLLAVNAAAMHGKSLRPFQGEGFAKGGIFGWVKNTASKGVDLAKSGVSWLKDGVKASAEAGLNAVVKPLLNKISGSASVYRDMVTGIPKKMIKDIVGYSGKADAELEKAGIGGKGFKGALSWARTQAGKAYQWGGNGDPSWDCSGFVSAIESVIRGERPHRRWATGAFSGSTAPPGWVLGAKSPYMIGITNAGVGHTAGTINGINVESRGGDGVVVGSRARSYMDPLFTHRYGLRGFASGGRPRKGELAWVGERGPELVQFGSSNSEVYDSETSMRMAAGLGGLRGFAKGTSKAKPSKIGADLGAFQKSLTGSASQIASAAKKLTKDLAAAGKAGKSLEKSTSAAAAKLQTMAKQRDAFAAKVSAAKGYAADQKSTIQDYLGMASLGDSTSAGALISGMKARQATVSAVEADIAKAAKRGASKDVLGQIIAMGPEAGANLASVLAGAKSAQLKQINAMVKKGGTLAGAYGNTMADLMYDAGKMASKGFLTGLVAEEKAIQKAMAKLGNSAIKAIRSKKGIDAHSPSRKAARAGEDVGAGVIAGAASMVPAVTSAAERLGAAAVPSTLVPVTAGRTGQDPAASLDGMTVAIILPDGSQLDGYVDTRVDAGLGAVSRRRRAGTKGR